jgi:hypothetical protein
MKSNGPRRQKFMLALIGVCVAIILSERDLVIFDHAFQNSFLKEEPSQFQKAELRI